MENNRLILGIDPGLNFTGWGIVESLSNKENHVSHGVIKTTKISSLGERLNTIYENLNDHLSNYNYLAGNYSIADIATFPWIARHNIHDIGLHHYPHLSNWYELISQRPAVESGYDLFQKGNKIPPISL